MGLMNWFWRDAPRSHETVWSSFHEEDGIHVIARELRRIAESLELLCNQRDLYEGGHIYDEVKVDRTNLKKWCECDLDTTPCRCIE